MQWLHRASQSGVEAERQTNRSHELNYLFSAHLILHVKCAADTVAHSYVHVTICSSFLCH